MWKYSLRITNSCIQNSIYEEVKYYQQEELEVLILERHAAPCEAVIIHEFIYC